MADALSQMLDLTEESGMSDQTMDVMLFLLQLVYLHEISECLTTEKFMI